MKNLAFKKEDEISFKHGNKTKHGIISDVDYITFKVVVKSSHLSSVSIPFKDIISIHDDAIKVMK